MVFINLLAVSLFFFSDMDLDICKMMLGLFMFTPVQNSYSY